METWLKLVNTSDPPLTHTPFTAYMEPHLFGKYAISYSAAKIKKLLGYQLKRPKLTQEAINEVIYTERDFVRDLEYLRDVRLVDWARRLPC